jgi:flagellar hook assembly protein FlgD
LQVKGLIKNKDAKLEIYDVKGRKIRSTLFSGQTGSEQTFNWDGKDYSGFAVHSGIYFCKVSHGLQTQTCKVLKY